MFSYVHFAGATLFFSATVTGIEAANRLLHPQSVTGVLVIALAGLIGFAGNEIAAVIRLRAGKHLQSPALIADGHHARVDGFFWRC